MGYGLRFENGSGGLTLSSEGQTYGYIGQATYVSILQPPTGVTLAESSGYSTYTIDWPGQIIVALPVKTNGGTALLDMQQSGSTWTITVHKGTGSLNSLGFDVEEATEVYVFGRPTSVSGWGVALYNQAGVLTGDLSRRPLTFDRYLTFAANVVNASFSGLSIPAVIGQATWYETVSLPYDSTFNDNRQYWGAWKWNSTLGILQRTTFQYYYDRSVDFIGGSTFLPAVNAIVMDASSL